MLCWLDRLLSARSGRWRTIEKVGAPQDLHHREMTMITDQLGRVFSLITLTCAGLIAMAGLACLVFGSYGLFMGLHGGPMVAGLLIVFGAGLIFVGYFCGRNSFQSDKDQ
jgi:hypothetical protein